MSIDDTVKRICRLIKAAAESPQKQIPPEELSQLQ
jgi:hypothetical protein